MFDIRINARDFIQDLDKIIQAIPLANRSAAAQIRAGLTGIIDGIYFDAVASTGGAFPDVYARHLHRGIRSLTPNVFATEDGLVAETYDIRELGDFADLERGFHYHALIETDEFNIHPQIVQLPYGGEPLLNDFNKRYDFWKAVVDGVPYTVQFKGYTRDIPTEGLYQQTLAARVQEWGGSYPEWILLDNGSEYYPSFGPTHFIEIIRSSTFTFMSEVYEDILTSLIDAASRPGVGINSANQLIDKTTGRYTKYLPNKSA